MCAKNLDAIKPVLDGLRGLECWYVNAGGSAGSSFSLAFGRRLPRPDPLKNPSVSEEFRLHEGEANLYVWCAWRLETEDAALASSDQDGDHPVNVIKRLQGLALDSADVSGKALDLVLRFSNFALRIFCDHVDPDPSYEANWELVLERRLLRAGPGFGFAEELRPVVPTRSP